jgi:hypothetical protein
VLALLLVSAASEAPLPWRSHPERARVPLRVPVRVHRGLEERDQELLGTERVGLDQAEGVVGSEQVGSEPLEELVDRDAER